MRPIPPDAEVLFIEATRTGTVHLHVQLRAHHLADRLGGRRESIAAVFTIPTLTRCGERTFPHGIGSRHEFVCCFSDDQLCGACYRTLQPDDQQRAFDHPQPDDSGQGLERMSVHPLKDLRKEQSMSNAAEPPLPPGTRVHHAGQIWACSLPEGTAEIIRSEGPDHRGAYEYQVRTGRDFARRPGPDNPENDVRWWASYQVHVQHRR